MRSVDRFTAWDCCVILFWQTEKKLRAFDDGFSRRWSASVGAGRCILILLQRYGQKNQRVPMWLADVRLVRAFGNQSPVPRQHHIYLGSTKSRLCYVAECLLPMLDATFCALHGWLLSLQQPPPWPLIIGQQLWPCRCLSAKFVLCFTTGAARQLSQTRLRLVQAAPAESRSRSAHPSNFSFISVRRGKPQRKLTALMNCK